jgi:rhodanese-related sulfurtransferase
MKQRHMLRWWAGICGAAGFSFVLTQTAPAISWEDTLAAVRKRFPAVRQLSLDELARWMSDTNRPAPLLLDVRSAGEYAVSHLEGAQRAETVAEARALRRSPARPVVVYCSVGYRSSALAEKLMAEGWTDVWNLEGSIFAWANAGRPVYRGSRRLEPSEVHPYDEDWGRLLRRDLWRFRPGRGSPDR